jgi:hypothetical protein
MGSKSSKITYVRDDGPDMKEYVDELVKLKYDSIEFKKAYIKILVKINGENAVHSHDNSQLLMLVDLETEDPKVAKEVVKLVFERYYKRRSHVRSQSC